MRAAVRQRNMTIIGSPDSSLTSTSYLLGQYRLTPDTLIHTQTLIAMHSCPDPFELYGGDHLLMTYRSPVHHFSECLLSAVFVGFARCQIKMKDVPPYVHGAIFNSV